MITPEHIYTCYPRKVGRGAAIRAIEKASKRVRNTQDLFMISAEEWLMARVQSYCQAVQYPRLNAKQKSLIPHPATWFNQGRYLDDPAEWGPPHDDAPDAYKPRKRPQSGSALSGPLPGGNHRPSPLVSREDVEKAAQANQDGLAALRNMREKEL